MHQNDHMTAAITSSYTNIWVVLYIYDQLWISFPYYCDFIRATLKSRVISSELIILNETIQLLCLDQT